MTVTTTEPLLVTVSECARMLSVGVRTVYRLLDSGEIPSVRIRGNRRIDPRDVRHYISVGKETKLRGAR